MDAKKPGKDADTTIEQLKEEIGKFVQERDWDQFHTPKNLSMALMVEAAELAEIFTWVHSDKSRQELEKKRRDVENELADVLMDVLCLARACNIDLSGAFGHKLAETRKKYPVEKCRGRWTKYTDL